MIAMALRMTGRVQGVGFRYHASQLAHTLQLAGTVRNAIDGTVMVEVQGPEEQVNEFVTWCRKGPLLASVAHVEERIIPITPRTTFDVIH